MNGWDGSCSTIWHPTGLRYIYVTTYIAWANPFCPLSYISHSKGFITNIPLTMHTLFLLVAYLFSATLATPVAQLFDLFEDDPATTINNEKGIQNFPQDFGTEGLQKAVVNDAPPFLTGDATTNYLQAQLPSQDIFSNFGGGCPSGELFCCRGGSGPPGSLITDDAFNEKCIPCTFYLALSYHIIYTPKRCPPALLC